MKPAPLHKILLRVTAVVAILIGSSVALYPQDAGAVRERGPASSDSRDLWCRSQLVSCLSNGFQACDTAHPTDTPAAGQCYEGVRVACAGSFGSSSDCKTLPRTPPRRPIPTGPRAPRSK